MVERDGGRVAGVVLAAGAASRFGGAKLEVRVGRRTLLERVVDVARSARLDPVIVVAQPRATTLDGTTLVLNDAPELGLSRSLGLGIDAVPADADGAVVLLADQPTVTVGAVDALVHVDARERPVVAMRAEGRIGPPVLVRRSGFDLFTEVTGDAGLAPVLAGHPERVAYLDADAHAPDVDVRDDLAVLGEPCPECDALVQPAPGVEPHAYIGGSPACWATFGEVLAREFGDPAYGRMHRHTVDVYAAQHPGVDGRRQRQSVAVHLVALCHWLEHGIGAEALARITRRLADSGDDWPWLAPPVRYPMTVADVLGARDGAAHERLVRRWAETVWDAWSLHHAVLRHWAAESATSAG